MVDATSPFGFDATLPGDAGFDYLTACLGDANVLMLAGDDGFMLTGASVVTPIVSIWGAAGFDAGSDISYVSLVTDAGYGMQFNGEIYGPSLAAGDYPELDAGDGRGSRIRLTFGSSASDTRIGSDMNILALTYSATGASWTVEDFTVTFVLYGMGYGAAPDYGCAHYQQ